MNLLAINTRWLSVDHKPVRREIAGVGLALTHAGILPSFFMQRLGADDVLITENETKS
jgi:hypothetical protein